MTVLISLSLLLSISCWTAEPKIGYGTPEKAGLAKANANPEGLSGGQNNVKVAIARGLARTPDHAL